MLTADNQWGVDYELGSGNVHISVIQSILEIWGKAFSIKKPLVKTFHMISQQKSNVFGNCVNEFSCI
jgi:hypothetical protein